MHNQLITKLICKILLITLLASGANIPSVFAEDENEEQIEELNDKIDEQRDIIQKIDEEIAEQQKKLNEVSTQKKSLQTEVQTLDTSRKKIETSIKKTENNIVSSNLTIEKLALEIEDKERRVRQNQEALAESIREVHQTQSASMLEQFLNNKNISDVWNAIYSLFQFRDSVRENSRMLDASKVELIEKQDLTAAEKVQLEKLQDQLAGEHGAVLATKQQKDSLLKETQNKESEYQRILNEKVAQKLAFEQQLLQYESQLQIAIDRNAFPTEGTTVLSWPLDNIIITQQFGSTEFAAKNPGVYGGRAVHNGVDFGTPVGTPLKATLSGTIQNTGNTDAIPGCYSWGKWILLKHDNGLTSLFAHLSSINVNVGDSVSTGDIIGYTGNTGYSTGPHLHYTLYASEGVRVVPFGSINSATRCSGTVTPTAPPDGYLDPMDYLPAA